MIMPAPFFPRNIPSSFYKEKALIERDGGQPSITSMGCFLIADIVLIGEKAKDEKPKCHADGQH